MSKTIAEQSHALSIFWLQKNGYLDQNYCHYQGSIWWNRGETNRESSIGFEIMIDNAEKADEKNYIGLNYTHTSRESGEKENLDYKIKLVTTLCNYGGKRYWFICPLSKNGQYCGRRVGVLFLIGKYYGCRHCGEIAYNSQMQTERYKGFVSIPDIEKAEKEVKRYYYNGKPTRKYKKVIELNNKFENGFIKSMAKLDKRFSKFTNNGII